MQLVNKLTLFCFVLLLSDQNLGNSTTSLGYTKTTKLWKKKF